MLITADNLRSMTTGFNKKYMDALLATQDFTKGIVDVVTSTDEREIYPVLESLPNLRKWEGDKQVQNLTTKSITIVNDPFEMTVAVPRDRIDDDKYGMFGTQIAAMGEAAKNHPNQLLAKLLAGGTTQTC
ncbi:MAG: Mu-like prophage major head subunit gpT family protein, partial [Alphaproteobacteria bacterium]|nr:Mu-like prophage major head subunit gpT family protein [Alphaproteobacteria bacterium]